MRPETMKRRVQAAMAFGLLFCAACSAQQPAKAADAPPATQAAAVRRMTNLPPDSPLAKLAVDAPIMPAAAEHESTGKSHDGSVKIHGHWVVEVKEKDGTVKDRREFENSYIGGEIMGLYLAGFDAPADPAIRVFSSTNTSSSLCNGTALTENTCVIFATNSAGHGALDTDVGYCALAGSCYTGLTTSLTPDGAGGYNAWVLSATITPVTTGSFDTVETSITGCYNPYYDSPSVTSPNNCYQNAVNIYNNPTTAYITNNNFTSTVLPGGPVNVVAGEVLVFTVTISFS